MCKSEWKMNDGEKLILKIIPVVGAESDKRSITFTTDVYSFLKERFGDVHHWCEQQCNLINRGQLNFSESSMKIMKRVNQGAQLSQREIGDLVRAYALNLWLDSALVHY